MAKEAPEVKNKGLLLVALVLGIVVVIIYNWHIANVRTSLQGKQVMLMTYNRAMERGEKVEAKDVVSEPIREDDAVKLGNVVQKESEKFLVGRHLRQPVTKGQWVLWNHVTGRIQGGSKEIKQGMVAITLTLDRRMSPGPLCRPGDRVNILAKMIVDPNPEAPARVVRLIRNVEILATGSTAVIGDVNPEGGPRRYATSYRSIAIEVGEDVSKKLYALLNFTKGDIWLEVLPEDVEFNDKKHGIINPDEPILRDLLQRAATSG